jgi:hypothetical protein
MHEATRSASSARRRTAQGIGYFGAVCWRSSCDLRHFGTETSLPFDLQHGFSFPGKNLSRRTIGIRFRPAGA